MTERGIEFTTEELLVLVERAELAPPSGLGLDSFDELPDAYRDYARESATRSLLARGILDDAGPGSINPAVLTLLTAAAEPALIAICSAERDEIVETTFHTVTPDLGVSHTCPATSVHRLTPFPPRELLSRVLRSVDVRPSTQPDIATFSVALAALEISAEQMEQGERAAAIDTLTGAGVNSSIATVFCAALLDKVGSANVTFLYKPSLDTVEGGSLTWIDTGLSGLWATELAGGLADEGPEVVSVEPYSGDRLAKELLSFLPDAFSEPSTSD